MAEKKDQARIGVAKKIRALINRQIPNEENAKRKAAAFMKNLEDSMPTMENAQRKADAFLKKIGAGSYSRASKNAVNKNATQEKQARGMAKMPSNSRTTAAKNRVQAENKPASKPSTAADRRGSNATLKPRTNSPDKDPKKAYSYNEAKKRGLPTYIGKDGKPKATVSADQLRKAGYTTGPQGLRKYLNAQRKKEAGKK